MRKSNAGSARGSVEVADAASVKRAPLTARRLAQIDAHVITREEYEEIPELTDADLEASDVFDGDTLVRRGRPRKPDAKVHVSLRLRPATLAHFKALGKGWQQRIEDILNAVVSFEQDAAERAAAARDAAAAHEAAPAKPARRRSA